jgi:hypothetical protein
MKKLLLLFLLPYFSCGQNNVQRIKEPIVDKKATGQITIPVIDSFLYKMLKQNIANQSIKATTYHTIIDSLAPYWYGTVWNFYGTTQTPNVGTIACGYFVTTLIRDAGIPVQRIHLAQQTASKIITTLCETNSIKKFSNKQKMLDYFDAYPNETLFILGLDCHVGFVAKENNKLYFIHSSYVQPAVVKRELLQESMPINSSNMWMLGVVN